ncbi:MAG: hypothetical protein AB7F19_04135 [Candidatus Babeliales bacterium]
MKVSLKLLTLVGVLLCVAYAEAGSQMWGSKQRQKPGVQDRSDCLSVTDRCRPCNRPKQKPKPKTQPAPATKSAACEPADRCPCNKPKPKPRPRSEQAMAAFRSASPAQQRQQMMDQVNAWMSNPCEENADMLMACAQMWCDRVKNQTVNKLVQEMMSSTNRSAVKMKLMRVLEV